MLTLGGEIGKFENSPEMSIMSLASFWKASMLVGVYVS